MDGPTSEDGGGLYLAPLLYDVVNTPGTGAELAALERAACRFGALPARSAVVWLEPACGTGRYLRALLRRSYTVRGYDVRPEMLAYAAGRLGRLDRPERASGPAPANREAPALYGARYALTAAGFTTPASALRHLGPADVAFCPVNSLRHLRSDRDVLAHLEQIAALLAPGGVYLVGLDLHHIGRVADEDVWIGRRGRLRVTQVVQYLPPATGSRLERVIVEMAVCRPRGLEHHSFAYDLRTYTRQQWHALVGRSALRRLAVCDATGLPVPDEAAGTGRHAASLPYQIDVLVRR